jgi:hypothetical protein
VAQGGVQLKLYSFKTSELEGGEGSASRPGHSLPPGKTPYPLYERLGRLQGRSGQVRKISPPPGFDPRIVQPVASRYTDYATLQRPYSTILECLMDSTAELWSRGQCTVAGTTTSPNLHYNRTNCTLLEQPPNSVQIHPLPISLKYIYYYYPSVCN